MNTLLSDKSKELKVFTFKKNDIPFILVDKACLANDQEMFVEKVFFIDILSTASCSLSLQFLNSYDLVSVPLFPSFYTVTYFFLIRLIYVTAP
jgi:hypothetical protein